MFWYHSPAVAVIEDDIGPRLSWLYPIKTLMESGARMSVGSDWIVTPPSPWSALETLVTRRAPGVTTGPALFPSEQIDLHSAVALYTRHNAFAQQLEDRIGSIEVGKYADFVVLDRDIFSIPIHQVHRTRVVQTVLGGQVVYQSKLNDL